MMKSEMIHVVFIGAVCWIGLATAQNRVCPPNETFNECGTACPLTCANPKPGMCTMQCVSGCFCNDGYLRDASGKCVLPKQCTRTPSKRQAPIPPVSPMPPIDPQRCPANKTWTSCGSACVPTCAQPVPPTMCTLQCIIGCQCAPGFLKSEQGRCVLPADCQSPVTGQPPVTDENNCAPNGTYNECGSACPPTCASRPRLLPSLSPQNSLPRPCPAVCVPGCVCNPGYLKNSQNQCVLVADCDGDNGDDGNRCRQENEVWTDCGTACPATCEKREPGPCTKQCVRGCQCRPGFLRSSTGQCVAPEACNGIPFTGIPPVME